MASRNDGGGYGRKGDKIIRDALLAAARNEPDKLKRCAKKMWDLAEEGDTKAFALIADRIDGKAMQQISHEFAPERNDEGLDAQLANLARKAGIAIIASSEARPEDEGKLPNVH